MDCQKILNAKEYLCKFDKILSDMSCKMFSQKITSNITKDFITCMIPHHEAAIYMCQNLLKYTNYNPLEKIANNIIIMQTKGVNQMQNILNTTKDCINLREDVNCYISKYLSIVKNMICKMENSAKCVNINLNFVNEMIPHHEGAVLMCENLLDYLIDPRLEEVAKSIIIEQTTGIIQLKSIKKELCKINNY